MGREKQWQFQTHSDLVTGSGLVPFSFHPGRTRLLARGIRSSGRGRTRGADAEGQTYLQRWRERKRGTIKERYAGGRATVRNKEG